MKKLIAPAVFSFCIGNVFAQQTIVQTTASPATTPQVVSNTIPDPITVHGNIYFGHGSNTSPLNTAIGEDAMSNLGVSGNGNTAVGYKTINLSTAATSNAAFGTQAIEFLKGNSNTGIGYRSLRGAYTTSGGVDSSWLDSSDNNTALGQRSLEMMYQGGSNTAVGYQALQALNQGTNNVGIGAQVTIPNNSSNKLTIQNSLHGINMGTSNPFIGINTNLANNPPTASIDVNGNARIRVVPTQLDSSVLCIDQEGYVHKRSIATLPQAPCTWDRNNSPFGGDNLATGYIGACVEGIVSVGADDGTALSLIPNGFAKFYAFNDQRRGETDYVVGSYSEGKADDMAIGLIGYGNSTTQGIGVYGMANFNCDGEPNIAIYGGPERDGEIEDDCPDPTGFIAGYFAGEVVTNQPPILLSDARLKTKVKDITNAEELISRLQPKSFYFKSNVEPGLALPTTEQYGFISQEVQEVLPAIVKTVPGPTTRGKDGKLTTSTQTYQGVQYDAMIALLVSGMQSQNEKIARLEKLVGELTGANTKANASQTLVLEGSDIQEIVLDQNVPNPFAEKTTIKYEIPTSAKFAEIKFHTATGQLIKSTRIANIGRGTLEVFGSGIAAGHYTYSLIVDGKIVSTRQMIKH